MHLTQGTFSFLPDLTDGQITAQIQYCIDNGWAVSIEHTADPHPRNIYWDMFGAPMFDLADAAEAMLEINNCRASFPDHYIKLNALDATRSIESVRLSFMVNRPASEPGFRLQRSELHGRNVQYTTHSYATERSDAGGL
tara:strand:+ start:2681 stop:3097 length:417 start_codon:yes stop_codon:yes gene_type:complete